MGMLLRDSHDLVLNGVFSSSIRVSKKGAMLEMEASGTFCYTHSSQVYINPCSFPSIETSIATEIIVFVKKKIVVFAPIS